LTHKHLDVTLGCDGTPFFMKKILLSPVTHFNLTLVGFLIMIQLVHQQAHMTMEVDVHSYVFSYCKKNLEECKSIINNLDY